MSWMWDNNEMCPSCGKQGVPSHDVGRVTLYYCEDAQCTQEDFWDVSRGAMPYSAIKKGIPARHQGGTWKIYTTRFVRSSGDDDFPAHCGGDVLQRRTLPVRCA